MARLTAVLALIFAGVISVFGQHGTIDKFGRYNPDPQEEETNKRNFELLLKPSFIKLRLVLLKPETDQQSNSAPAYPYPYKTPIAVQLILTQYSSVPITLTEYANGFRDTQLELLRDGEKVTYAKKARQAIELVNSEPPSESSNFIEIIPERDYRFTRIDLSKWYGNLLPGHYYLTVRKRFAWGGDWVQSESLTFDIASAVPSDLL
jgi:hypothetical protein